MIWPHSTWATDCLTWCLRSCLLQMNYRCPRAFHQNRFTSVGSQGNSALYNSHEILYHSISPNPPPFSTSGSMWGMNWPWFTEQLSNLLQEEISLCWWNVLVLSECFTSLERDSSWLAYCCHKSLCLSVLGPSPPKENKVLCHFCHLSA